MRIFRDSSIQGDAELLQLVLACAGIEDDKDAGPPPDLCRQSMIPRRYSPGPSIRTAENASGPRLQNRCPFPHDLSQHVRDIDALQSMSMPSKRNAITCVNLHAISYTHIGPVRGDGGGAATSCKHVMAPHEQLGRGCAWEVSQLLARDSS